MTEILPEPDDEARTPTDRIIVAIPTATEPIHHVGDVSEPKHLTMIRLGSPEENPDLDSEAITEAVRSAAEHIGPLTGLVESSGELGDDGAQVAFLRGDGILEAHDILLEDPAIKAGHDAVEQYPKFTPHITLGYEPSAAVSEDDLPEEVIFDRLALWDGDEHTEFPLGPSASTEENTDGPEAEPVEPILINAPAAAMAEIKLSQIDGEKMGLDKEFLDELVVAMIRPLDDPLVVKDAATLASACAQADALTDEPTRLTTQRVLMRRARALGCQHVIPTAWLRRAATAAAASVPPAAPAAVPSPGGSGEPDLFKAKTQSSTLSDTVLRAAYMRGVREYTMTAPQSRPPLPRDVVAQARVNSLIRLAQGDLSARTDDQDLLP